MRLGVQRAAVLPGATERDHHHGDRLPPPPHPPRPQVRRGLPRGPPQAGGERPRRASRDHRPHRRAASDSHRVGQPQRKRDAPATDRDRYTRALITRVVDVN